MSSNAQPSGIRFTSWRIDDSVSLSVYSADVCGIYILEFADGEEYVGQTRHLLSRFSTHRRRWPGEIVGIQFAPMDVEFLDEAERDVIAMRERAGAKLRNVDLIGMPLRSSALDHLIDRVEIEDWLRGDEDTINIGDRGTIALQRQRTRDKFKALTLHSEYPEIRDALAVYVGTMIPYAHRTERRVWVVTSLPSTGRTAHWKRLAVISINNVETVVIGEEKDVDGNRAVVGFVNLGLAGREILRRFPSAEAEIDEYRPVGKVLRVFFDDLGSLRRLLHDREVVNAARQLAVGLLRKGGTMSAKYHDFNLADELFAMIERGSTNLEAKE